MTVDRSAQAARDAGAQRVVLLHVSPRYENRDLKQFTKVAREIHPAAELGREGQLVEVPLPD